MMSVQSRLLLDRREMERACWPAGRIPIALAVRAVPGALLSMVSIASARWGQRALPELCSTR